MGDFDVETAIEPVGPGRWRSTPVASWNIGETANGGYAMAPVLRAIAADGGHPDPLSVTTHFLRPLRPDPAVEHTTIETEVMRQGRTTSVVRGTLSYHDRPRLTVLAAFGELSDDGAPELAIEAPPIPPPDDCLDRSLLEQGVALPILDRLDVRIHPDRGRARASTEAVTEGWIRFADGTEPTAMALTLFADAFPPSLYARLGRIGWVPTVELTVHVRRPPSPGWVQARLECDDLGGGRMIETGCLWDRSGALVARSRQLGLLLAEQPPTK